MPGRIVDRVFVITEDEAFCSAAITTVTKNSLTPADNESPLGSYDYIRKKSSESGDLSFIKNDIIAYIKQKIFPFLFILDLRINTGHSDTLKVLKTILVTYIILSKSEYSKDILLNIAILAGSDDFQKLGSVIKNPSLVLNILKTGDEKINMVIDDFKINNEHFNNFFTITVIEKSNDLFKTEANINLFINKIKLKQKLRDKLSTKSRKPESGIDNKKTEPALILYSNGSDIYINGENSGTPDPVKHNSIIPGELYIHGPFTGYNRLETVTQLKKIIKNGLNGELKFAKDDDIYINLSSDCRIDATIPVTLAQLLIKDLPDYKKIKIKINKENRTIMEGSQGYSMLKRYIIFTNE